MSAPQRRSALTRHRENRSHAPSSSNNARGAKSRSPDTRTTDEAPRENSFTNFLKKKRSGGQNTHANHRAARQTPGGSTEEAASERGRKGRHVRPPSHPSEDGDGHTALEAQSLRRNAGKNKKKEPSSSGAATVRLVPKASTSDGEDLEANDRSHYGSYDYSRLLDELDALKRNMAAAKKTIHKQSKTIDELKKDLSETRESQEEERQQIVRLKGEHKKSNEIITSVEANLSCQICMDMLLKPYGLSPCGHVHCLGCLQEWFRKAPVGDDEMEDDDPQDVLYRRKTCPVCRTTVLHRPIPLFVIKSIANALDKARSTSPRRASPALEGDPWEGIFPQPISPYFEDEDDEGPDYGDIDDYDDDDDDDDDRWSFDGYGTGSDSDTYEGEYVPARWAPPTVSINPDDYPFEDLSNEMMSILRRGATPAMVDIFSMSYSHDEGLLASVDGNEIYLGWNINLHDGDEAGEEYMEWVTADVINHPERWDREDHNDHWTAWRLIREDEDEEYDSTDSEEWAAGIPDHMFTMP